MMKINSVSKLRKERQRLIIERTRLEKDIQTDWQAIRRSVTPSELARRVLSSGTSWIKQRWQKKKN